MWIGVSTKKYVRNTLTLLIPSVLFLSLRTVSADSSSDSNSNSNSNSSSSEEEETQKGGFPWYAILLVVIAGVIILVGVGIFVWFICKKRSEETSSEEMNLPPDQTQLYAAPQKKKREMTREEKFQRRRERKRAKKQRHLQTAVEFGNPFREIVEQKKEIERMCQEEPFQAPVMHSEEELRRTSSVQWDEGSSTETYSYSSSGSSSGSYSSSSSEDDGDLPYLYHGMVGGPYQNPNFHY